MLRIDEPDSGTRAASTTAVVGGNDRAGRRAGEEGRGLGEWPKPLPVGPRTAYFDTPQKCGQISVVDSIPASFGEAMLYV